MYYSQKPLKISAFRTVRKCKICSIHYRSMECLLFFTLPMKTTKFHEVKSFLFYSIVYVPRKTCPHSPLPKLWFLCGTFVYKNAMSIVYYASFLKNKHVHTQYIQPKAYRSNSRQHAKINSVKPMI